MAALRLALCALALAATLPVAAALKHPNWSWLKPVAETPQEPLRHGDGSPAEWKQAQEEVKELKHLSAPHLKVRGKTVLCHTGSVWVVLQGDLNTRYMTFGDSPDSPVKQTMVSCRGRAPDSCFSSPQGNRAGDSCNLDPNWCPCDFDMPQLPRLDMEYQFITDQLKKSEWGNHTDLVEKAQAKAVDSNPNRDKVLMIGLGGGMLPQYLLEHVGNLSVDAVELDKDVVSTARAFFGVADAEASGRLRVTVSDGLTALKESKGGYGAVIVDCTVDGLIPEACRSWEFIQALFSAVRDGGEVMQNVFTGNPRNGGAKDNKVKADLKYLMADYVSAFGNCKGCVSLQARDDHSLNAVVLAHRPNH